MLVNVSVPAKVARVPVVGRVTLVAAVEVNVILLAPEVANVELLARVNVPVVVVTVKPLTVLLVNASEPAKVARVPVVGRVTLVFAVVVKPRVCAPVCVKSPPMVIVFPELFTPVPPYCPAITVPCQIPVPIVPTEVNEEPVTPEPNVVAERTVVPLIS